MAQQAIAGMPSASAPMFMVELGVMARICVPFCVWNAGMPLACTLPSWPLANRRSMERKGEAAGSHWFRAVWSLSWFEPDYVFNVLKLLAFLLFFCLNKVLLE